MQIPATQDPQNNDNVLPPIPRTQRFYTAPWWLFFLIIAWLAVVFSILTDPVYSRIYDELKEGIALTLYMAIMSYFIGIIIGLMVGLVRSYRPTAPALKAGPRQVVGHVLYTALYNALSLYVCAAFRRWCFCWWWASSSCQ